MTGRVDIEAPGVPGRRDDDGFSSIMGVHRIEDLAEVRRYIDAIDFTMLRRNMTDREDGLRWPQWKVEAVEQMYKRWVFLRRRYEDEELPPTLEVDKFWHEHILDTRAYLRDCARIFGYYHHHFPYFGMRGEADNDALEHAFERMMHLYETEFGAPIETGHWQDA